jgi:LPS O-antigen subunit length determinant protein (WzzB/FepE family)
MIMQEPNSSSYSSPTFQELFLLIYREKFLLIIITLLCSLIFFGISLFIPNHYKAYALLSPKEGSESNQTSSLGSLAKFAGIKTSTDQISKTDEAIARILSFDFFMEFIEAEGVLENLIAVKGWSKSSNTIIYDDSIINQGKWNLESKYFTDNKFSYLKAYDDYLDAISIYQDNESGFIHFSFSSRVPNLAQEFATNILYSIDTIMRDADRLEAKEAISFLEDQLKQTSLNEIKLNITELLKVHLQDAMMTEVSDNYVFKIIDSPRLPEKKSEPQRIIYLALGMVLGMVLGFFTILFKSNKKEPY